MKYRRLNSERYFEIQKNRSIIATEIKYRYVSSFSVVEFNEADIKKDILNLNGKHGGGGVEGS